MNQNLDPEIIAGEGLLIPRLLHLLKALREKDTVPVVEWEKYESVFEHY